MLGGESAPLLMRSSWVGPTPSTRIGHGCGPSFTAIVGRATWRVTIRARRAGLPTSPGSLEGIPLKPGPPRRARAKANVASRRRALQIKMAPAMSSPSPESLVATQTWCGATHICIAMSRDGGEMPSLCPARPQNHGRAGCVALFVVTSAVSCTAGAVAIGHLFGEGSVRIPPRPPKSRAPNGYKLSKHLTRRRGGREP